MILRRDSKPEIEVPRKAAFGVCEGDRSTGWIVRLSVAGADLEAPQPPAPGAEIIVWVELLRGEGELALRGRVQWSTTMSFGVQFGRLGARETNAIVRVARRPAA